MKNTNENNNDDLDLKYYLRRNRFFDLLKKTKKHKDLLWSKEAVISLLFTVISLFVVSLILSDEGELFQDISNEKLLELFSVIKLVLPVVLGGFFSVLGLTIGGLAIVTGTISQQVISNIRAKNKLDELMSVVFNFYFAGAVIGVTIIISILSLMVIYIPLEFSALLFYIWFGIAMYFIIFSLIYSVMLLGTCIRIFLLKYVYDEIS